MKINVGEHMVLSTYSKIECCLVVCLCVLQYVVEPFNQRAEERLNKRLALGQGVKWVQVWVRVRYVLVVRVWGGSPPWAKQYAQFTFISLLKHFIEPLRDEIVSFLGAGMMAAVLKQNRMTAWVTVVNGPPLFLY